MDRWDVRYDAEAFLSRPGARPRGPVTPVPDQARALDVVRTFLAGQWSPMAREPAGRLRHPFLCPGGPYRGLWDWDAFFIACALPTDAWRYGVGSIRNLLDGVREDGRPPKAAAPDGGRYDYDSHPIPLQAQFAYLMARREADFGWVDASWPALESIRRWYERETRARGEYFVWLSFHGNGIDNNPSVYGRPPRSSAGVDLACWHIRENLAMVKLGAALNRGPTDRYAEAAARLTALVQRRYWDAIDRFFYNVDCLADRGQTSQQGIGWEYFLKLRNCASLVPLWSGVATRDQAEAVRARLLDPAEFLSPAGCRSHSAADPLYNNTPSGNPSNWQGPVWGLSTCWAAYGLARYGYRGEAADILGRLIRTFAGDIQANGCLHEFYHGDTGQPLLNPGFMSWNLLAPVTADDLAAGRDSTSGDLE